MNIINELPKHTGTDAEVAALINADPAYWGEITSDKVWAWLAGGGRLYVLESFAGSIDADADSAALIGLKSAVGSLLKALNNTLTTLDPTPGSDQRTLIDTVATALSMDVSDLLTKGRPAGWVDVTEADVTAAVALQARRLVISNVTLAANAAAQAGVALMVDESGDSYAEVRAAMVAEFDARTP